MQAFSVFHTFNSPYYDYYKNIILFYFALLFNKAKKQRSFVKNTKPCEENRF